MYAGLLHSKPKLDEPLKVQVKVISSPGQVRFPSRSVPVNNKSGHDTDTAAAAANLKYVRKV